MVYFNGSNNVWGSHLKACILNTLRKLSICS